MRKGVVRALLRVSLMTALQYRSNFLMEGVVGALSAAMAVVPLIFVFDATELVAGWSLHQALLVSAFFLLFNGLIGGVIEPNLAAVVEGVRQGTLDFVLLKPVDAQLLASTARVAPPRLWDLVAAVVVAVFAFRGLPPPTLGGAAAALALTAAGLAAIYSLWILAICLSFWFVRVDNLRYLLSSMADAGRWPVDVYRGWVRLTLTVFVPVALVTSYPAMALLGRMQAALAAQAAIVAVCALVVSRFAWKKALQNYTSASS